MWLCCFGNSPAAAASNAGNENQGQGNGTRQSAPSAFKLHEATQQAAPDTPGSAASGGSVATAGTSAAVTAIGLKLVPDAAQDGQEAPKQLGYQSQLSAPTELQSALWGSGNLAHAVSGMFQGDRRPGVLTVADFNHEIQDLAFIGQGASGDVYRGRWQGATVAVKYIVCQSPDAQQAATNEAALGRLLAHPNVVQTYSCKTSVLDEEFYAQLKRMLGAPRLPAPSLSDDFQTPIEEEPTAVKAPLGPGTLAGISHDTAPPATAAVGASIHEGSQQPTHTISDSMQSQAEAPGPSKPAAGQQQQEPNTQDMPAGYAAAAAEADEQQFWSGEGFGNPLGQRQSVLALQEVLLRADAKLGFQLTQIVMEHCDKGSLLQAINRGLFLPTSRWGPRLALRALLRTAQEVAQGMWHIHQANVIHGDLKPGNVLLKGSRADRRGFVAKVSDFGLSRISEHTTRDSQHWGTVHYMAPETFDGVLARQSDVYSFGITLWQMVTGAKPWENLHPGQIIVGVQAGTLTLEWPQNADPWLVRLGQSCLQHDRKKRPGFNIIMKELSQIENMVRLQGAVLPENLPEAPGTSNLIALQAASLAASQATSSGGGHAASMAAGSHAEPVHHASDSARPSGSYAQPFGHPPRPQAPLPLHGQLVTGQLRSTSSTAASHAPAAHTALPTTPSLNTLVTPQGSLVTPQGSLVSHGMLSSGGASLQNYGTHTGFAASAPALQLVDSNGSPVPLAWVTPASNGVGMAGQPPSGQLCVMLPGGFVPAHFVTNMPQPAGQQPMPVLMVPSRPSTEHAGRHAPTLQPSPCPSGQFSAVGMTSEVTVMASPENATAAEADRVTVDHGTSQVPPYSSSTDQVGMTHAGTSQLLQRRSKMSLPHDTAAEPLPAQSVMLPSGGIEHTPQLGSSTVQATSMHEGMPSNSTPYAAASLSVSAPAVEPHMTQVAVDAGAVPFQRGAVQPTWHVRGLGSDPSMKCTAHDRMQQGGNDRATVMQVKQ